MLSRKVLVGAGSIAGSIIAFAAATIPAYAQSAGEIYIRGDLGWSGAVNANLHDRNFSADHVITGENGTAGTLSDLGSGWLIGLGTGIQLAPNFRSDLVYTYRGDYHMDETDLATPPNTFRTGASSHSIMANVYADFPITDSGIAPFIGVGLGWSEVKLSELSGVGALQINPLVAGGTTEAFAPGGSSDNFGWQITAGLAFVLDRNTLVDLFYRYFDGGHVQTPAGNVTVNGNVVRAYSGVEGAFHVHELGLSLRYLVGT